MPFLYFCRTVFDLYVEISCNLLIPLFIAVFSGPFNFKKVDEIFADEGLHGTRVKEI